MKTLKKLFKADKFINRVYIYEPNLNGDYDNSEGYEYLLQSNHKMTNEEFTNIIFQACEIERIYKGNILVEINIEKNGEYYDSDTVELNVNMKLTNSATKYIQCNKCPSLPIIYAINKEKSTIKNINI